MEKANIGFKAGIILEKLGETGLITIAELARRLKHIYQKESNIGALHHKNS